MKISGDNLEHMNSMADSVANILRTVRGVKDLGILRNIGQPELSIILNQSKMAAYGVTIADADAVIEMRHSILPRVRRAASISRNAGSIARNSSGKRN